MLNYVFYIFRYSELLTQINFGGFHLFIVASERVQNHEAMIIGKAAWIDYVASPHLLLVF